MPAEIHHSSRARPPGAVTSGVASTVRPSRSRVGVSAEATRSRNQSLTARRTRPAMSNSPGLSAAGGGAVVVVVGPAVGSVVVGATAAALAGALVATMTAVTTSSPQRKSTVRTRLTLRRWTSAPRPAPARARRSGSRPARCGTRSWPSRSARGRRRRRRSGSRRWSAPAWRRRPAARPASCGGCPAPAQGRAAPAARTPARPPPAPAPPRPSPRRPAALEHMTLSALHPPCAPTVSDGGEATDQRSLPTSTAGVDVPTVCLVALPDRPGTSRVPGPWVAPSTDNRPPKPRRCDTRNRRPLPPPGTTPEPRQAGAAAEKFESNISPLSPTSVLPAPTPPASSSHGPPVGRASPNTRLHQQALVTTTLTRPNTPRPSCWRTRRGPSGTEAVPNHPGNTSATNTAQTPAARAPTPLLSGRGVHEVLAGSGVIGLPPRSQGAADGPPLLGLRRPRSQIPLPHHRTEAARPARPHHRPRHPQAPHPPPGAPRPAHRVRELAAARRRHARAAPPRQRPRR